MVSYSYEAVVPAEALSMFQDAFCSYMANVGLDHLSVGGRLGGYMPYEFR